MNASQEILVATDFLTASKKGLAMGHDIARKLGLRVVLVHVCETPMYPYPGVDPVLHPSLNREVTTVLEKALEREAATIGGCETILKKGDPAAELLELIEERQPRYVILGTHGRSIIGRAIFGSTALKIHRRATVPVISIRADDAE